LKKPSKRKKNRISKTPVKTKNQSEHTSLPDKNIFPVVGIGASAGGLEAMEQFFENTLSNSGMAYVVIQHLDPTREGILPELLQRMTKIKVQQVENGMAVQPDHIYVIPHNKSMSIAGGILHLFEPVLQAGLKLPIDYFFRSLANDMNERAVGIIMSGMGSDGSLGMMAIKEKFGITAIQNPETAKFDSMPRNAAEAISVDISAAAKDLPEKLAVFFKNQTERNDKTHAGDENIKALEKIITILRNSTGNDFSLYKINMVHRRIERRMVMNRIVNLTEYCKHIKTNPGEINFLLKELLIGVTNFFRDPKLWTILKAKTLPEIIANNRKKQQLRAWVAGCSTGEEAYSLAIIFKELMDDIGEKERVTMQIFATDIDTFAIAKARKGTFAENISAYVSPKRLKRFFNEESGGYQINNEIREMITFAPQNVIKDPPFANIDIILCRNLLIYLEIETQNKVMQIFHYALNPSGLLILGSAESVNEKHKTFLQMDFKNKIYKANAQTKKINSLNQSEPVASGISFYKNIINPVILPAKTETLAEQLMLQQYSPAGVLVNTAGEIIYISGHTGKYMEPAPGKINWNIFAMLKEGLRGEFGRAFKKALKQKAPVVIHNIHVNFKHLSAPINITIHKLNKPAGLKGMVFVVFRDAPEAINRNFKIKSQKRSMKNIETIRELHKIRETLHANEEEMQTSQEELKSVNEELQSNIEELQSSNEELTTSKEEMQSINEELQIVNTEMQSKMNLFEKSNSDLKNLINNTDIAVLFLNTKNCITQFSFTATKIFNLREADIGRPFTDLATDIIYPDLVNDISEVLRSLVFTEKEIQSKDNLWYRVRVMPYRTADDRIDGLVITFTDITVSKNLEAELRKAENTANLLMNSVTNVIISFSKNEEILSMNKAAEKFFGRKSSEVLGKNYFNTLLPEPSRQIVRSVLKSLSTGSKTVTFNTQEPGVSGEKITIKWQANMVTGANNLLTDIIVVGPDRSVYEK